MSKKKKTISIQLNYRIRRLESQYSDESSLLELNLDGQTYALKLCHNNGDPGYSESGRDLNRYRRESNAYRKLAGSGACEHGFVPRCYGYIDRVCLLAFDHHEALQHFAQDKFNPLAMLLEYLPTECREAELR